MTTLLGYIGPGAGLGFLGSLLAVVAVLAVGALGLVIYPIKLALALFAKSQFARSQFAGSRFAGSRFADCRLIESTAKPGNDATPEAFTS